MRFTMKSPINKNEKLIESGRKWSWDLQWNPQTTRMRTSLKAAGNEYEIYNEIPKLQEWKIDWKQQGIDIKFAMKIPLKAIWNRNEIA